MAGLLRLMRGPLLIWAALGALLLATLGYAFIPHAPFKTGVALAFALIKAALIVGLFMELPRAAMLVRLAAGAGLAWLSLLFLFGGADYLTR